MEKPRARQIKKLYSTRIYCNGHVNREFDWERETMDNDETFYLNTCY
jgi:hypothetical protein